MEEKGLARAVGALRAELHSLGLSGARIVIEVTPAQWHAMRRAHGTIGDVEQLELVSDVVNGDVVVRPSPAAESISKTVEQLADLGLQPPTLPGRVEQLEKIVRGLLEQPRTGTLAEAGKLGKMIGERFEQLERRVAELERGR